METLKKILKFIYDLIEVYLPVCAFVLLFFTYVILIIQRYFLKTSVGWLNEFNVMMFLVCVMLNSSYGSRTDEHIVFSIIYDKLSDRVQLAMRMVVNITTCVVFAIILPQAYKAVMFMSVKRSSLLKVPYHILYFPFLIFLVLTILHHFTRLIQDVQGLIGKKGDET